MKNDLSRAFAINTLNLQFYWLPPSSTRRDTSVKKLTLTLKKRKQKTCQYKIDLQAISQDGEIICECRLNLELKGRDVDK